MTLEEAKSLGPGDMIEGNWGANPIRTIVKCWLEDDYLYWYEESSPIALKHS